MIANGVHPFSPTSDWRDPAQYPDPNDTSMHSWAWEFLVRNAGFLADVTPSIDSQLAMSDVDLSGTPFSQQPLSVALARWGVSTYLSPDLQPAGDARTVLFGTAPRRLKFKIFDGTMLDCTPTRIDRVALEFDLDAPLEPQLARARRSLTAEQRVKYPRMTRRRSQTKNFAMYLRLLDATASGASTKEILDTFSREFVDGIEVKTLSYWKREAIALRDGRYLDLLKQ